MTTVSLGEGDIVKKSLLGGSLGLLMALPMVGSSNAAADTGQATILRVRQPSAGGDGLLLVDSPDDPAPPPAGTVCHEIYVLAYRETHVLGGGSNAPSQAPWSFYATSYTLTFPTADGNSEVSDVAEGFTDQDVVAFSDDQRVSSLTVAATVQMTDGSAFAFNGTWTGYGDRWVYGSNGPYHFAEGLPRHFVDRCSTFNSNDHQTGRNATLVGTINRHPFLTYQVYLPTAAIFYNHFLYIDVKHGGCA